MSTKKAFNSLRRRGLEAFHILGRLPDVYQSNFFMSEQHVSGAFPPIFAIISPRVRSVTQASGNEKVQKPQEFW